MISDEKLFRIAMSYYKNGKTQSDIASELGVSHVQVGKYLKLAKERGIIEIRINAPFVSNDKTKKYALYLKETFGLSNLILVPSAANEKQTFRFLVDGACDYLIKTYPNKALNIGLGQGKTITGICSYKPRTADKRTSWHVYPVTNYSLLVENYSNQDSYFSYKSMVNEFSDNWGSKVDKSFMDSLRNSENNSIKTYWKNMDLVIGGVGVPISRDPDVRAAVLGKEEADKYALTDIQGDYLNYFFDDNGHIVKPITVGRHAMSIDELRGVKERIAIASGFQKIFSIIGLLKCNVVNTLITDIDTAENLVEIVK